MLFYPCGNEIAPEKREANNAECWLETVYNLEIGFHLFGYYPITMNGNQNYSSGCSVCFECKKFQVRYVSRFIHI